MNVDNLLALIHNIGDGGDDDDDDDEDETKLISLALLIISDSIVDNIDAQELTDDDQPSWLR